MGNEQVAQAALQLCRELAEAIRSEIKSAKRVAAGGNEFSDGWNHGMHEAEEIARSFIPRPPSPEAGLVDALETIVGMPHDSRITGIATEALKKYREAR